MSMNDDHLLNETILAPNSQLPSPLTFSTQIVRRFHIKRFTMQKGDAINLNNIIIHAIMITYIANTITFYSNSVRHYSGASISRRLCLPVRITIFII